MRASVGPGHELYEEVGGVDCDGAEHDHAGLPRDALVSVLLREPGHRDCLEQLTR